MKRSSLTFAAILSKILPDENISSAQNIVRRNNFFDSNILSNEEGKSFLVKIANNEQGEIELQKEIMISASLEKNIERITFGIPEFVKEEKIDDQLVTIFVVPAGRFFKEHNIGNVRLTTIIQVLREIHNFPKQVVTEINLPIYSAANFRQLFIDDLNSLKEHGVLDIGIEKYFSDFLSNDDYWNFESTVIHGNAKFRNFLFRHDFVKNVIGWNEIKIADPAYDLATILSPFDKATCAENLKTYRLLKGNVKNDPYLEKRVRFYSEFQMAKWLLYGVETGDKEIVNDGTNMLLQLKNILENEKRMDETKKQYEVAKLQDELATQHLELHKLQSESNLTDKTIDNLNYKDVIRSIEKKDSEESKKNVDELVGDNYDELNNDNYAELENNKDIASDNKDIVSEPSNLNETNNASPTEDFSNTNFGANNFIEVNNFSTDNFSEASNELTFNNADYINEYETDAKSKYLENKNTGNENPNK